jgi:hypothetical protein
MTGRIVFVIAVLVARGYCGGVLAEFLAQYNRITGSDEPEGTPLIDLRDDLRRQRVSAADHDVPVWMAEIAASMNAIAMSPE